MLAASKTACVLQKFKANKIIYRRYAGLFFVMCVDVTDNELSFLESIHLFVEILDHYFSNVCELDLVFNFHKVRATLGLASAASHCCAAREGSLFSPARASMMHCPMLGRST